MSSGIGPKKGKFFFPSVMDQVPQLFVCDTPLLVQD
jgi:hypothetical protein